MSDGKIDGFRTVRGYELQSRGENKLTSAMEDYLEMTYRICLEDGRTRVGKLSERLHVKPSSVSKMLSRLAAMGYVRTDNNDSIILTEQGNTVGEYLLDRHEIIERFLLLIGEENPLELAEMLEHSIGTGTMNRVLSLVSFFDKHANVCEMWEKWRDSGKYDNLI
jgi:Mn-dependent DtxR family transcriptional regulator